MDNNATAPLSKSLRAGYGLGLAAEGIKNNAFNMFLLFYYQQVVGLDPGLCGLALFVALCVDAITDPAVGMWSDRTQSRLGRRHPFMYASSLPLAVCFYLVWTPPDGLSGYALFAWLTCFAVLTRFAMTLFTIPHQALVAELTSDPAERTALQTVRTVFGWLFGLLNTVLAYTVFFAKTPEYPKGLLNPEGYPKFALFGAAVILLATSVCSLVTQRATLRAADLARPTDGGDPAPFGQAIREAFRSPSYQAAVVGGLVLWVGYGLAENLHNYMNSYFWGFTSEQIALFIFVILLATIFVQGSSAKLVARFGKRRVAMGAATGVMFINPITVGLRFAGALPEQGTGALLLSVSVSVFFGYFCVILTMVMIGAMIADVTDEHELRTGRRQEGLLFASLAFVVKASSGLGVLGAGALLKVAGVSGGPDEAAQGIESIALGGMLVTLLFGPLTIWAFGRFDLDGERHAEIRRELQTRHAEIAGKSDAGAATA